MASLIRSPAGRKARVRSRPRFDPLLRASRLVRQGSRPSFERYGRPRTEALSSAELCMLGDPRGASPTHPRLRSDAPQTQRWPVERPARPRPRDGPDRGRGTACRLPADSRRAAAGPAMSRPGSKFRRSCSMGEVDRRSPVEVTEDLHARIPGSALVVLSRVGHLSDVRPQTGSTLRSGASSRPSEAESPGIALHGCRRLGML